jgi:hypothetical protein
MVILFVSLNYLHPMIQLNKGSPNTNILIEREREFCYFCFLKVKYRDFLKFLIGYFCFLKVKYRDFLKFLIESYFKDNTFITVKLAYGY